MDSISECYRILDLEPGASLEEVKQSYRELVKVWHPDRFRADTKLRAKAEEKLKRINLAYERLCDEVAASAGRRAAAAMPPRPEWERTRSEAPEAHARSENNIRTHASWEYPGGWICRHWNWVFGVLAGLAGFVIFAIFQAGTNVTVERNEKLEQLLKAADQGEVGPQMTLGKMYFAGDGVPKDLAKGAQWYQRAGAQGDVNAQRLLGELYSYGIGVPKDDAKAAQWYEKAAAQGDHSASFHIADMYERGTGIPQSITKATEWHEKAAAQGDAAAKKYLANKYADGDGIPRGEQKAVEWYQKAADQGDTGALPELAERYLHGEGVPKDEAKAFKWYYKAAIQGDSDAQLKIATMYQLGTGVSQDQAKANEWFTKVVVQPKQYAEGDDIPNNGIAPSPIPARTDRLPGNTQETAEAQFRLGKKYEFGLGGMSKDLSKAVELYQKAAAQGHAECQVHLSLMYNWGRGVAEDRGRAFELAQASAAQGNAAGQFRLGSMYHAGWGVPKDGANAAKWWEKAAIQGYTMAQYNLGIILSKGIGVDKDPAKAAEWLRKAAEQGDTDARNQLAALNADTTGITQDGALPPVIAYSTPTPPGAGSTRKNDDAMLSHLATDDRLVSGSLLVDRLGNFAGKGKLTLDNGLAEDAYVKLILGGKLVAAFYVRSHERFTYRTIPDGNYTVAYCTGYGWDGSARNFARGRRAHRYDNPLSFSTRQARDDSGVTTYTDVVTLTLHKVAYGNAKSSDMSLDDFDRY